MMKLAVPCLRSGAAQHWLWILQQVPTAPRKKEALFCSSLAAASMWARDREAKMPAVLLVLFWDLLQ